MIFNKIKIGIINMNCNNLYSIFNSCQNIGYKTSIIKNSANLRAFDIIILPGVGSFKQAIHTFTATDAITEAEHAGRTLLLGEVGGNAAVTLTLPAATGTGAVYKFIVSVTNTSNYKIQVADATDTIDGIMLYLDEDGTAVTAFPTVAASDTITLNGGTTGGIVGDYLELIDIATNQYHVRGVMRVAAGANPATPFTAAVS